MHAFKLSVTAGPANPRYPQGTVAGALCLVDSIDADVARHGALVGLNALGWESCTFLDVVILSAAPNLAAFSPAMQEAYAGAKEKGVSIILYPPGVGAT